MIAEVISIGDELTSGQRLDTNSQWLSERLGELGIRTLFHTTVADDIAANEQVFRAAAERADVVVATGGLGPTADDLTRQAIAGAMGLQLVRDEAALAHIQALFARRQRPMPARNEVQAMFPAGSRVIPNPHGSAPGIDLDVPRDARPASRIFALPGVPAEMREMWFGTVEPALLAGEDPSLRRVIRHRRLKCFGVGESDLEQMLPDLIQRGRQPSVGITVSKATITLRITAEGATPAECLAAMEPTEAIIHECLGKLVFGEEDDELQHVVARLLAGKGQTVATAEWGTGGLVAHWLSETPTAGAIYSGGLVIPTRQMFARVLDLAEERLPDPFPGGEETVLRMARRAREIYHADYGLAVGEFPALESAAGQAGLLYCALVSEENAVARGFPFGGHPEILKPRAAKQALNLLRLQLID